MDALLKLAQDSGMSESQGQTATGGLFSFLKERIPAEQFAQIEEKLPGVDGAVDKYGAKEGSGTSTKEASGTSAGGMSGMFESAMASFGRGSSGGASSSSSAGGALAGLMATLTSKGIDPSMLQQFIPQVSALVKSKCGVDISQYLGGAGEAAASAGAGESSSSGGGGGAAAAASNMMGQAMGMFGKK